MYIPADARILIVKLSAIGDVIQTLPALNTLREIYPKGHISWLVEESAREVVQNHSALDEVIVSRRKAWPKDLLSRRIGAALTEIGSVVRSLRRSRYDLIIDFQGLFKSGIWVGLAKGGHKVGFGPGMQHQEGSYWFLNRLIPAVSMEMHALDRYLWLLDQIGLASPTVKYRLPITAATRQQAEKLLNEYGVKEGVPLVALNPMTRWVTKHWPYERLSRIADRLVDVGGAQVVFTGSAEDFEGIEEIRQEMTRPSVNLAGQTSLLVLGALFERVGCVITTDTGPMHLAAAVKAPVVALFGPTAPWRTGPYGEGHSVVRMDLPCSPCFKRKCELSHHKCMNDMTVERVWEVVRSAGCFSSQTESPLI